MSSVSFAGKKSLSRLADVVEKARGEWACCVWETQAILNPAGQIDDL